MRKISTLLACAALLTAAAYADAVTPADRSRPPFQLGQENASAPDAVFEPKNPYNIFINYELGMHCAGFNISCCCIVPPYNSVQAQAVRSGVSGSRPVLLSPEDGYRLRYSCGRIPTGVNARGVPVQPAEYPYVKTREIVAKGWE